jgi:predicted ATP-dependent endonuclease of OLD family
MKIEIKNFGPIESLEFDMDKDMHLIYGHNGIGKSYATYCIYCVLKNIKNKSVRTRYFFQNEPIRFQSLVKNKIKGVKGEFVVDITKEFHKIAKEELSEIILGGLQNSLQNTFSSLKNLKNRFTNEGFEIIITLDNDEQIIISSNEDDNINLEYISIIQTMKFVEKNTKSTRFALLINGKIEFGKQNEDEFSKEFVRFALEKVEEVLRRLDSNIRDIYYLPASRSGLYQALNAFTPIIAELTQNRFFIQNKNIELPSLSEPLSDYFIDLSTVDKKNVNKEFKEIIKHLQDSILKGEVEYNDETRKIIYKPVGTDLELNLSEASSMVAEISPIVIFFKHIINHKYSLGRYTDVPFFDVVESRNRKKKDFDVIFIEEPEAHLHPEIQVELIEIFTKLSEIKLKIFITSHSNYMFNKINNLILKNEIDKDKIMVYHLIKTPNGSTQNKKMQVTPEGIEDDNFQEVSENLYLERMNIYEK